MARLLCFAFLIPFCIIESTAQKRHGFKPEILHITNEEWMINSPVEMNAALFLRSKRETKTTNDDEVMKPKINNEKQNFRDGNSTVDPKVNVRSNITTQTTNNITTVVRFHCSFMNIEKFIKFNRIQFLSNCLFLIQFKQNHNTYDGIDIKTKQLYDIVAN